MQRIRPLYPASTLPSLGEVRNLVREGLGPDWIFRIEHLVPDSLPQGQWTAWDKPRFVPREPDPIIDTIQRCHHAHPDHALRLCAEKLRPETQLVYWIYTPGQKLSPPPRITPINADLTTLPAHSQYPVHPMREVAGSESGHSDTRTGTKCDQADIYVTRRP